MVTQMNVNFVNLQVPFEVVFNYKGVKNDLLKSFNPKFKSMYFYFISEIRL